MLASVADEFDYIVIDAGNDANLGLMISALNVSDSRYFVTTQQSKAIHRLIQMKKNITQPLGLDGHLIINKYMKDPALFLKRDIESLCEIQNASMVPYLEYGWQMEMEGRTLMHFHKFAKSIEQIVADFEETPKKEKDMEKEFCLEDYLNKALSKEEAAESSYIDQFYAVCQVVEAEFDKEWNETNDESKNRKLEREKRAIMGFEEETRFYKEKIKEILIDKKLSDRWHPDWYPNLCEGSFC